MALLQFKIEKSKQFFLDDRKILNAVKRAKVRALLYPAAAIRLTAIRSIRKRDGTSQPGSPPLSHGAHLLRSHIYYLPQPSRADVHWVLIGAARLNKPGLAPNALEFGGDVRPSPRLNAMRRKAGHSELKTVKIAARPFMKPALDANIEKVPAAWKNAVVIQ